MSQVSIDTLSRHLAQSASRRSVLQRLGVGAAGAAVTAVGLTSTEAKKNKGGGKGKGNKGDPANIGPFDRLTAIPLSAHAQGQNFKGTLDIVRFEAQNDAVVAIGTITGKVTGKEIGNAPVLVENVVIPVSFTAPVTGQAGRIRAQATCQILDLTLGPIDLHLLGLRLQVNQIHIQLTAQQGGGLLGDLLCAVANLLNPLGPLADLVAALNNLLAALGGL